MNLDVLFSVSAHVLAVVWAAGMWQGALFVGLAVLLLRLMPRVSATLRHFGLIVLFVLTMGLPWLSLLHPPEPAPVRHSLHLSVWVASVIAGWWAVATLYRTISLMIAWQYLREVRRNAVPVTFDLDALNIGVSRRPLVCTSASVDTPVIVGFFRPVLLLPEWLAPTLSTEEFRQIALHECEHLRRRDDWTNLWLQIGMTMFPLNPALLWLNRRIGVQRELACDAAVVAATARPTDYAASLVHIASQRRLENPLRFALAAWGRQSEISQRVHALLEQPCEWTGLQRAVANSSMISLLLVSVTALAFTPQFVSIKTPVAMNVASSQNPASTETVAEVLSSHPEPAAVHFVPTSYATPPVANLRLSGNHGISPTHKRRVRQSITAATFHQTDEAFSSRLARVSDAEIWDSSVVAVRHEAPARALPVLFVPTYLAVPVSGGWIVIQL
jgi:beta-lactamase regulating signal transducer with metallopeptidase domain